MASLEGSKDKTMSPFLESVTDHDGMTTGQKRPPTRRLSRMARGIASCFGDTSSSAPLGVLDGHFVPLAASRINLDEKTSPAPYVFPLEDGLATVETSLIQSLEDLHKVLGTFSQSSPSILLAPIARSAKARETLRKVSVESIGVLKRLHEHTQVLVRIKNYDAERWPVLHQLEEMSMVIQSAISVLCDSSNSTANIIEYLRKFNKFVSSWASDSTGSGTFSSNSPRILLQNTVEPTIELSEASYLERAFRKSSPSEGPYKLGDFISWGRHETSESTTSQNVGPVTSVSLFCATTGLLRNEFVIVGFENGKNSSAWLRIERAARMKARWLVADNLGPLFSGIESRDIISFSLSREVLFRPTDSEVASISINMNHTSQSPVIYLGEFSEQLYSATRIFPQYFHLAANCRWFAQRILINFTARLSALPPDSYSILWKKTRVNYDDLLTHLPKESSGGPQLLGNKGVFSHVETILGLAHSSVDYGGLDYSSLKRSDFAPAHLPQGYNDLSRHTEALNICNEALRLLEPIIIRTKERDVLMGRCLTLKCYLHRRLGQPDEAHIAGETALAIFLRRVAESPALEPSSLERLSDAAIELGRKEDYIDLRRMSLGVRRDNLSADPSDYYERFHLGVELVSLSWPLSFMNRFEEAIKLGKEGLEHLRASHALRPAISAEKLSSLLYTYSLVLSRASAPEEAYSVSAEAVSIRRSVVTIRRDHDASLYYQHAIASAAVRRWDESILAAKESIKHFRSLTNTAPETYNSSVLRAMRVLSSSLSGSGQLDQALEIAREMVEAAKSWFGDKPESYRSDLAFALYYLAARAADLRLWDESIAADEQSIELYQSLEKCSSIRDSGASNVIRGLQAYSYHLTCAGRSPELSRTALLSAATHYRASNIPVAQIAMMEQAGFQLNSWQKKVVENDPKVVADKAKKFAGPSSTYTTSKISCNVPIHVVTKHGEYRKCSKRWFSTPPIDASQLKKIISLQLSTLSRDQGFGGGDGASWSWFEVAITRPELLLDTPHPLPSMEIKLRPDGITPLTWVSHRNTIASKTHTLHHGLKFDRDHELWLYLSPGDCISVYAATRYAAWECMGMMGELVFEEQGK